MKTTANESSAILKLISNYLYVYLPTIKTGSGNTSKSYNTAIDQYLEWLEDEQGYNDTNITKECFEANMVESWMIWLANSKKISKSSINVKLAAVRSCIKYLAKQDPKYRYLAAEMATVSRIKTPKRKIQGMSRDAITAIFSVIGTKTKSGRMYLPMIILLYGTAARIDEILSIKISDVSLRSEGPFVTLHGKGAKVRNITILSKTVILLSAYIQEFHGNSPDPDAYLFWTAHKGKYKKMSQTAVRNALKKYAEKAHEICPDVPLEIHPHKLRHAKATHLLEDGFSDVQVAEYLGHSGLQTVHDYIDVSMNQKNDAFATLEDEKDKQLEKKWKPSKKCKSIRDAVGTRNKSKA